MRVEGAKVLRIVPVEKMAAVSGHQIHGREGRLQPLDGVQGPDPSQIPRADGRHQIETDIGRRGAVSHDRSRRLLEIVRRQHVFGRGDEGLEKSPGLPGDQAQGVSVRVGHRPATGHSRRLADTKRHRRRNKPDQGERRGDRPGPAAPRQADRDPHRADDQRPDHPAIENQQSRPGAKRGVRRRDPFQQMPPRERQSNERAKDGVGHQPGLVAKKHDHQARLDEGQPKFRRQRANMAGDDHVGSAWNDPHHDRAERLGDDGGEDI